MNRNKPKSKLLEANFHYAEGKRKLAAIKKVLQQINVHVKLTFAEGVACCDC